MSKRVWIAQCLCPQRHAIMAAAGEDEATVLAELKDTVWGWLARGVIRPWCSICHAEEASWHFEVGRTKWRSMDEAYAEIKETEARNVVAGLLYGDANGTRTKH